MPELIERQAALEIAMSYCPDDDGSCSKAGHDIREMLDEIEALPIVHIDDMAFNIQNEIQAEKPSRTVEITFVRNGRWIVRGQEVYCSECNEESLYNPFGASKFSRFCPNCGTRMDATDTEVDRC